MRKVIVAALALYPMLLQAQTNSPAPAPSSAGASSLHAELGQPMEFASAEPSRTNTGVASLRISTEVIAPKLISTVDVSTRGNVEWTTIPMRRKAVVALIVDENGKPSNMKIVQSLGDAMDKNILEAVSKYRFKPGTVSHQPVASPVSLEIEVRNQVY